MKTITRQFSYVLLATIFLLNCASIDHEEPPSIKEIQADREANLGALLAQYKVAEYEIVMGHYKRLKQENQADISFEAYHSDLTTKYRSYLNKAVDRFESESNGRASAVDIQMLREEVRSNEAVPDWYWQFKLDWKHKIKSAVTQ